MAVMINRYRMILIPFNANDTICSTLDRDIIIYKGKKRKERCLFGQPKGKHKTISNIYVIELPFLHYLQMEFRTNVTSKKKPFLFFAEMGGGLIKKTTYIP